MALVYAAKDALDLFRLENNHFYENTFGFVGLWVCSNILLLDACYELPETPG